MSGPPAKLKLRVMEKARKNLQCMQAKGINVNKELAAVEKKIIYYGKLAKQQAKHQEKKYKKYLTNQKKVL